MPSCRVALNCPCKKPRKSSKACVPFIGLPTGVADATDMETVAILRETRARLRLLLVRWNKSLPAVKCKMTKKRQATYP